MGFDARYSLRVGVEMGQTALGLFPKKADFARNLKMFASFTKPSHEPFR
jgi:hypothetical protein